MRKMFTGLAATAMFAASANAQVLTFEGIAGANPASIGNFYNGGSGPNFGIEFFGNALAINSSVGNCGGSGNFAQNPSGCGVLFFLTGGSTGMNRAAGFSTGFSLFYSAAFNTGSLQVFSGLNGTGSLLATLALPTTGDGAGTAGCSATNFCPWRAVGVGFAGTAQSIVFAGVADQIGFDDVTFGSVTPGTPNTVVPEPSTYALMATGLFGVLAVRRRRNARG
jgi:PEP-CTERM motif